MKDSIKLYVGSAMDVLNSKDILKLLTVLGENMIVVKPANNDGWERLVYELDGFEYALLHTYSGFSLAKKNTDNHVGWIFYDMPKDVSIDEIIKYLENI